MTSAEILQYVYVFYDATIILIVLASFHSAYRKFHEIDPLAFSENKKGSISFVTVADSIPQLKVSALNTALDQDVVAEQPLVAK